MFFEKQSNSNLFIHVMLCFGDNSCFLMKNPKVGNQDQTELHIGRQSVKF